MVSRIKDFIEFVGMTDAAFAKKIGVKQPTLWSQLRSVSGPSGVTLSRIAREFPELDCNWLLRGEGNMIIEPKEDKRLDNLIGHAQGGGRRTTLFSYVKVTPEMATKTVRKVCDFIASTENF